MKNDTAKARLEWVREIVESKVPESPYVTVARFDDEKENYPAEAWSLVVEFDSSPDLSGITFVNVRFLVDDAPKYLLHSGSKFELYAGRKLVASGEII